MQKRNRVWRNALSTFQIDILSLKVQAEENKQKPNMLFKRSRSYQDM
jgi:hypothetical protein